jgi:hypothetical protein
LRSKIAKSYSQKGKNWKPDHRVNRVIFVAAAGRSKSAAATKITLLTL